MKRGGADRLGSEVRPQGSGVANHPVTVPGRGQRRGQHSKLPIQRGQTGYSACAPFPTTALLDVLRIELMVEVGPHEAAKGIKGGALHEALCWIGFVGERDGDFHRQ